MVSRAQIQKKHRAVHKDAYRYWLGVGLLAGGLSAAITVGAGVAAAESESSTGARSDSSSARPSKADRAVKSESRQSARERGPRVRTDRRAGRGTEERPTERLRQKLSAAKVDRDVARDIERTAPRRESRRQWVNTREVAAEAPNEVPRSVRPRQARAVEARTVEPRSVEPRSVESRAIEKVDVEAATATDPAAPTKFGQGLQERVQATLKDKVQAQVQERLQAQVQPRPATVLQSRLQAQRVRLGEQLRAHLVNLRERLRAGIFTPVKPVPVPPVVTPPVSAPPVSSPPEVVTPKPPTLIWESNFDNLDDAQRHWRLQSGRWGEPGGENQYYTPDGSNVWVNEDGVLVIEARRETPPDGRGAPDDYTSARVVTYEKVSVEVNSRIVARIKMPYTEGTLPAFWMVGEEPGHHFDWPRQGEIDIVEVPGLGTAEGRRMWHGNIHGPAQTDNTTDIQLQGVEQDLGVDLSADFHEYGIDWYSDKIIWHVDGVQTGQITRAEYEAMGGDWTPFSGAWPHYLIMNVAIGNPWTGDPDPDEPFAPQQMQVDWVRVYQLDAV
ncbi:family 16 glycosylhydrolase [Mycolicibacterium sp.]|uniref:glycoside hydrolase family 16 protein n=1 Tax=Mycolicibacterium sp. TaxID=2320850 RepID=UPI003560FF98